MHKDLTKTQKDAVNLYRRAIGPIPTRDLDDLDELREVASEVNRALGYNDVVKATEWRKSLECNEPMRGAIKLYREAGLGAPPLNEAETLVKTNVYFRLADGGDGSYSIQWYLSEESMKASEGRSEELNGYTLGVTGVVETFVGSNIYQKAYD
jgi:hypothetical protein